jgi:Ca2+-binding EF-hand superfamily protein
MSSISTAYGGSQAQRLLAALLQQQAKTGQDVQGATDASAGNRPSGPHPGRPTGPRPGGGASGQFAASTLTDLLSTQAGEETSPSDNLAADLIKQADTNGDGSLSADEIKGAIGGDPASSTDDLSAAMAKLDTDGNGALSASELSAGLETRRSERGRRPGHAPPSSSDVAAKLISQTDSNGDGALGLDEIKATLGSDAASAETLTGSISKLDTDGDGKLSAAELSAALDAFRTANQRGSAEGSTAASSTQAGMTA